jgi:hypothetical protein
MSMSGSHVLAADYIIDYKNGTIPIGDLPIGTKVVDPSWQWEFRLGVNYSNYDWYEELTDAGDVKPVTWIIVAKNHYEALEPHVTLLSAYLVAIFTFDDSNERVLNYSGCGYNHWGDSGTGNATRGLRPWLNSTGIHKSEGFYRAFSENFRRVVLATSVPNRKWENGTTYYTNDYVFIPSVTELGNSEHEGTYLIGSTYPYFQNVSNEKRIAVMFGNDWRDLFEAIEAEMRGESGIAANRWSYWTRSPDRGCGFSVRIVYSGGDLCFRNYARYGDLGVRPVLNLKADTLVTN